MFTVHPVQYTVNEDKQDWFHNYKQCACQTLFLANILIDVDSLIYVTPNILFLDAPENLWSLLGNFDSSHIAAAGVECGEEMNNCQYTNILPYPYVKPYGLSSNIMLMNLTRMREKKWHNTLVEIYSRHKNQLAYGDQDILNIYFATRKTALYQLGCEWNYRPRFCRDVHKCRTTVQKNGVRAVHRGDYHFGNLNLNKFFDTFAEFNFDENFTEKFLNVLQSRISSLRLHYDTRSCGNVVDSVIKHLTC